MTPPTLRLFHEDATLRRFEAEVVAIRPAADHGHDVCLDRTAFYATAGGQPHDTGRLGGLPVSGVEDESGVLWHRVPEALSGRVTGEIDWERRLDHMQQHTGQHVLSQAFIECCGAETVSFHLGVEGVTIDLSRPDLEGDALARAEARANEIVRENREVKTHWTTRDELHRFPLRKPPVVEGAIRIVEVDGFDFSACGGTHVARTGEIGLIKVLTREKVRSGTRVAFLCGGRALADYGWKHELVRSTAERFSTLDRQLGASIEKLEADNRDLRRRLKQFEEEQLDREADLLAAAAVPVPGGGAVVEAERPGAGLEELKGLALRLRRRSGLLILLAGRDAEGRGALVIARSDDRTEDSGQALKRALEPLEGRGGGRPELAQGSGPRGDRLAEALRAARAALGIH